MQSGKLLIGNKKFKLTIDRLCHQLIEEYGDFENTCIIGIQPRGPFLADRILSRLKELVSDLKVESGRIDITFYRDDFRRREKPLSASTTELDFLIEDKNVILVDDVLYTGRTVQAALTALQHYGRPNRVELMAMVDRRFNRHLPIKSDYKGLKVDALDEAYVKVLWEENGEEDSIFIYPTKPE